MSVLDRFDEFPEPRPVPSYVVTGGRARPTRNTIRPETLLVAVNDGKQLPVTASSEKRALLKMCHRLLSLVEAAAHLRLPVSVAIVVACDLVDEGFLRVSGEFPSGTDGPGPDGRAGRPGLDLLEEVLRGLQKLV
jgi:Protein of unknown function (DUF742)